jgi:HlyD family secretion protein
MSKKSIILIVAGALVMFGVVGVTYKLLLKPTVVAYQYATAEARNVRETVKAIGAITPSQSVDLSFERSGRVSRVFVKVGDAVKAGQTLMQLDNSAEGAQVLQARALLNQRQAGTSPSEIGIYQAAADAAKADLEKTKADTAAQITTAQAALDTAQNNLKIASSGDDSEIVDQAYENAVATLQASLPKLGDALTQADQVLGVDNATSNMGFQNLLSVLDTSRLMVADNAYHDAKDSASVAQTAAALLTAGSPHADVDAAFPVIQAALTKSGSMLSAVSDVLDATVSGSALPQATLNGMKSTIQTTRSGIVAQGSTVNTAKQGIDNAKNSLASYTIAFNKATQDLTNAQNSAAGAIKLKEAAFEQAQANLNNKTAPVRYVDVAPLRAALDAASVAYSKTILKAPFDGVVSKEDGKVGAIILPNVPVLSIIDEHTYQLELIVAETDLSKISVGEPADVTLDAYGSATSFPATVVKVDPSAIATGGTNGYKVTLQFAKPDERIKVGLTANATIVTQDKSGAVAVPERSVVQNNGDYFVLKKSGQGAPVQTKVQVGIKGSDGWWEITDGLQAGDQVVDFGQ